MSSILPSQFGRNKHTLGLAALITMTLASPLALQSAWAQEPATAAGAAAPAAQPAVLAAAAVDGAEAGPGDRENAASASPTLRELEEKIGILERKLENAEETEQTKKETGSTPQANRDGFQLKSNDGDFLIRWRGYIQADARYFPDDEDNRWANTFLLRRIRPIWEATAWKYYSARIMVDFTNSAVSVLDAYVDLNFHPLANVRLGKFKAPIGFERLQSATDLYLIERSYTTALVPNRNLGFHYSGSLSEEVVAFQAAIANGVPDGGNRESDSTDHKEVYGRIFAQPFKKGNSEWVRNLGLGFAASYGVHKGDSAASNLATIRSPAQLTIFNYRVRATPRAASAAGVTPPVTAESRDQGTVHAFGDGIRLNPHGYWYIGSFGLFGEYVSSSQEVRRGQAGKLKDLTEQAWQVTASYYLTGEQPHFRTPRPRHPLAPNAPGTPGNQGWGAFELVGRVSQFKADGDAFPTWADPRAVVSEALSYGVGLNWHFSKAVKWANNYEYTQFKDGAALSTNDGDRESEHILLTRLQFVF